MLLDHLLSHLPGAQYDPVRFRNAGRRVIRGVTTDSRSSAPGMLFVSLPERQRENPFQACAAHDRGCAAVVRDEATPAPRGASCVEVDDACSALGWIAAALHDHPSRRLDVFGVAGEAGPRARLAGVLAELLGAAGGSCARFSPGECASGDRVHPWEVAGMDASHVQLELARHAQTGGTACVLELGHDALAESSTRGVEFRRRVEAGDVLPEALVPTRLSPRGSFCSWHREGRQYRVATPLAGRLQLAALGRALEMAADAGISMARLLATVPTLRVATGWLEPVHAGQAFGLFVDAACDARSMESTLACARELTQGRLFVVTGPRPDTAGAEMLELAHVCGVLADAVVVTTDDLAPAEFALRAPEFAVAAGGPRAMAVVEADRHQALRRVCGAARAGDVVIVAGKAANPTQRMGDVLIPWDDRAHLGSVLGRMGYVGGDF